MSECQPSSQHALHGVSPQGVIAALRERGARLAAGRPPEDGRRIALVIEGGAMRGVVSGAGAAAIDQLGLRGVFDEVYATSAGAMNAAYFLSGQAALGITIYFEELASREFINPWRLWKIMDVDLVFSHIISRVKPLNVEAILASRTRFLVAMSEYRTGSARLVDVQTSPTPLTRILKAATSIPVLYNRLTEVDGEMCFDGGLQNPFPIHDAVERCCTDILVLLSRPASYVRPASSGAAAAAFDLIFAPRNKAVRGMLRGHHRVDQACRDLALGRVRPPDGVRIATICAPDGGTVHRSTSRGADLWQAAMEYGQRTMATLGYGSHQFALAPLRASDGQHSSVVLGERSTGTARPRAD
jgi:predicted patatin/cPLA2 family phospholipase